MKPGTRNAERLLALYERVADAPDAIARLRRFVLDLAVRGKLVEQDPDDEPASILLRSAATKSGQGTAARRKGAIGANRADLIFDIPSHWEPVFVSQILQELQTGPFGSSLHKSDYLKGGTPVLNPASIQNGRILPIPEMAVGAAIFKRLSSFKVRDKDILMARRGEMGRCAVVSKREAGWLCGTGSLILRPSEAIFPEYLALVISSPTGRGFLSRAAVGTTMQNLNQSILLKMPFGLPPLAEQRRIVTKVEELMALLDRLAATRTAVEANRERLTTASFVSLTAPDISPETFPAHARFALDALPALTTRSGQLKALRQTILNLAVRGKLVEQDPNDEPASELLKRIAAEKESLVRARVIKKEKPLPTLYEEDLAFNPAPGWTWCRFGSLVLSSDAGWSPRTESHPREGDAWGVLKVSGVSWDYFDPNANKQVLPGTEPRLQAKISKGDFLISRANTADLVARAVLIDDEPQNLMMSDKIVRLRLATELDHSFIWLVNNNAQFARTYYAANATGVSPSMKNVSRAVILNLPIPLPPLAEQRRIVGKVDALMALCDRLEAALTTADTTKQRLLEALLHEALTPTATARELEAVV